MNNITDKTKFEKTVKKEKPNMSDIPDYIGLPKKQKKRTENKW